MTGRSAFPADKRLQRDVGRLKDRLTEAIDLIVWQAQVIDAAGIDVAPLVERRAEFLGVSDNEENPAAR